MSFKDKFKYGLKRFFTGRYGIDYLSILIMIVGVAVSVIGRVSGISWLFFADLICIAIVIFRAFSRNITKRQAENMAFMALLRRIRLWFGTRKKTFSERNQYKYLKCKCGQNLRVPRGKGKIKIKCPKCGQEKTIIV